MPISGPLVCSKAAQFSESLQVTDFKCSVGWLNRFKARHGIFFRKISGEEKAVNVADVQSWKDTVLKSILERYRPQNIYNADESASFYRMMPSRSLIEKGDSCTGVKQSKERLTILVGCSMNGERLPLLVIGKSKAPRCFRGITNLPTEYNNSKKAWMTMNIFEEWVRKLDKKMKREGRKVCLVVDNCTAHSQPRGLTHRVDISTS